jgi:dienelactone hydrolase
LTRYVIAPDVALRLDEMNTADADWQLIVYGRAMHGFTHRHAVPGATAGVAYDAIADERSFAATSEFLANVMGER